MKPATDSELKSIQERYVELLEKGNSQLKAAYLAASECGFVDIAENNSLHVKMIRPEDGSFVVCSMPFHDEQEEVSFKKVRDIRFHTDNNIFK